MSGITYDQMLEIIKKYPDEYQRVWSMALCDGVCCLAGHIKTTTHSSQIRQEVHKEGTIRDLASSFRAKREASGGAKRR